MDDRTQAEINRYEEILATCRSAGFRYIIEDATRTVFEIQSLALAAKKWEDVCMLRGRAEQLAELINLEAAVEYSLKVLNSYETEDEE